MPPPKSAARGGPPPLATPLIAYTEMYIFFRYNEGYCYLKYPFFSHHHMLSMHSKLYMLFFGCLASKNFKIKMVKSYFIYGKVLKVERYSVINVMRNTTAELTIVLKLLAFKKCAFAFSRIYVVISFFRMVYSLYTYLQ